MADCPGVLHLAQMADGGLARLRVPGGRLSAVQARAVAEAAQAIGSGEIDLTNRANLQIRGLRTDDGAELVGLLETAGFRFFGDADRRRNILLDPFSGLDPSERRNLRPLAEALDEALLAAPWIGRLSPKFSFALDGGGQAGIATIASDVTARAGPRGISIMVADKRWTRDLADGDLVDVLAALAEAAARVGPDARARELATDQLAAILGPDFEISPVGRLAAPTARYGVFGLRGSNRAAVAFPAPVGRIDAGMLAFLADVAEQEGDGALSLAPWSAVVATGVAEGRAHALLAASEAAGFTPLAVAERLAVTACSGAPACERAREPAKSLAREILRAASRDVSGLPAGKRSLHLSACPKGCAGSAAADLLLLGDVARPGWSIHHSGAPRRPGPSRGRVDDPGPENILKLLAAVR